MRRLVIAMMIPLAASRPSSPDQTITAPASLPTDDDPSQRQWTDWKAFTSAVLDATNTYREQYQAANLAWNSTLSDYAARYLDSSGKATKRDGETSGGADGETRGGEEEEEDGDRDGCKPEHSGGPYGENLAIGYGSARESVEAWGDEGQEYTQGQGFTEKTGHFTQLVWKDTTDVGCARRLCGSRQGWYLYRRGVHL
ncbi:SCP protein [Geosmithia morbida]|uniref:SCP protein n=1 Tax=Geosmithia morbida TaxID=1094350 RepID=A0A9P5D2S2_9HYPO|nr:SCP protein [Geosmithia morbida]KAF4119779.1 SCP protein [Geosmithia morbida]